MARGSGSALSTVIEHAPDFPLADGFRPKFGTSGFRGPAEKFLGVAFRCGVVTALRCYASKGDCGLVITASHNPVNDNGVKFVDFNGEMFPVEWEVYAQQIVDAETPEDLSKACEELCEKENISLFQRESEPYQVFMGHDTRPSAEALMQAAIRGIKSLNIEIAFEAILQTTPQVHFRVWRRYLKEACGEFQWLKYLAGGYMRLARGTKGHHGALTVDCANGVTFVLFFMFHQDLGGRTETQTSGRMSGCCSVGLSIQAQKYRGGRIKRQMRRGIHPKRTCISCEL